MAATVPRTAEEGPEDRLAALHRSHYRSLVRLAWLLLGDQGMAEEAVQEAFVKIQLRWRSIRDGDRAVAHLRSAVLNGARSQLRRRQVRDRHAHSLRITSSRPSDSAVTDAVEHLRVVAALRQLPLRQREALALKFYADLPEAGIAEAMGIAPGSVKSHVHRGLAAMATLLEER